MCRKKPLKLVLTSATLDAEKFSAYFDGCPVLHIPGRQYSVQVVFSEENHEKDYAAAAVDAALDLHLHEAPGDILIFLTGQAEIDKVTRTPSEPATASMVHAEHIPAEDHSIFTLLRGYVFQAISWLNERGVCLQSMPGMGSEPHAGH